LSKIKNLGSIFSLKISVFILKIFGTYALSP
jgi:hypothetical protein